EARARALLPRLVRGARNVPTAELGQCLPAEARATDAEEDDGAGPLGEPGERRLRLDDVGGVLRDAQMRQAAAAMVLLQARNRRPKPIQPAGKLGLGEAVAADRGLKAAVDRLPVRLPRDDASARTGRTLAHARALARFSATVTGHLAGL